MIGRTAIAANGLAVLLPLATLGEGGGSIGGLLAWHGWLVAVWIAWLLAPETTGTSRSIPRLPLLAFSVFLILAALGAARAPYGYAALLLAFELAAWTGVAALAVAAGPALLTRVVWTLRLTAALQGSYVIFQRFALGQPRPAATFLNPNHLGLWMAAVLLLSLGVAPWPRDRRGRWLLAATVLPALVALLLTGSRGAMLAFAAGAICLASFHWHRLGRRIRIASIVALVGLGVLGFATVQQRLAAGDPFFFQRLNIWQASAGALHETAFWGTGPGQFRAAAANLRFPDADGPLRYDKTFSITHSDLLRVPVEFGVPAAIALSLALLFCISAVRRMRRGGALPASADGGLAALVAIGTHAWVDNPSTWPALYLLSAATLGAVLSVPSTSTSTSVRRAGCGWRAASAGLLFTLFVVGEVGPTIAASKVATLPRGPLTSDQAKQLGMALRFNPQHPDYWRRLAEAQIGDGHGWDLARYAEARDAAERSVRLQPADARYHRGLARVEATAARTLFRDSASVRRTRAHYHRAQTLSRYDPFLLLEEAAFLMDVGDPHGAWAAAERALTLEPESVVSRLLLADAVLAVEGARGAALAERLLAEARGSAERWSDWLSQGNYARGMLQLDVNILERIERTIAGLAPEDAAVREALVDIY